MSDRKTAKPVMAKNPATVTVAEELVDLGLARHKGEAVDYLVAVGYEQVRRSKPYRRMVAEREQQQTAG